MFSEAHADLLDEATNHNILIGAGLRDPVKANKVLRSMVEAGGKHDISAFLPNLLEALRKTADPDRVLDVFAEFQLHRELPELAFHRLAESPRAVEILVVLLAGSQFLSEILFRDPGLFDRLAAHQRLGARRTTEQMYAEIQDALAGNGTLNEAMAVIARMQSWEMLRIGICDLLGLWDLPTVTRQLSNLADAVIRAVLKLAAAAYLTVPEDLTVVAMGKLGGRELNYSSDIDLILLTSQEPAVVTRLAEMLVGLLSGSQGGLALYRVDLRLRPWGAAGPLVSSIPSFMNYLRRHAETWEKQALMKARPVAGDQALGREFLQQARGLIFSQDPASLREAVFLMKQRVEDQLRQDGHIWGEVKLGEGSIRDVEFTVQYLQMRHGLDHPEIQSANTLEGLVRLTAAGFLSVREHRTLAEGYVFMRSVEHFLQMMHYRQIHALPGDRASLHQLALRLGFSGNEAEKELVERYDAHRVAIRAIYLRYLGGASMSTDNDGRFGLNVDGQALSRHLDRMGSSYADSYSVDEIHEHAAMATRLSVKNPLEMRVRSGLNDTEILTIVALDYPGELSIITGLLYVHGLDILSGEAFTYDAAQNGGGDPARKIVDVFTVRPVRPKADMAEVWVEYRQDLVNALHGMRQGRRNEVQADLVRRVAGILSKDQSHAELAGSRTLYPIDIRIDNDVTETTTVLRITSQDTVGFLYEFANALAIDRVYVERMIVETVGSRAEDIFFVTDEKGRKLTDEHRLHELRAATVLVKHFTHLLPHSPNPESALVHFRSFIDQLFQRPDWPEELASLQKQEVLQGLARLLGVSDFLWEDFLRMQYANLYPVVTDMQALSTMKSHAQLQKEMEAVLARVHAGPQNPDGDAPWIRALNDWKDREMLRIDMRHILGHTHEFQDFSAELTDLAEVVANATFHLCHEDMRLVYGTPMAEDGSPSEMTVEALGKFGGAELGFASDIELMFIYSGTGQTSGPKVITNAEFYEKVVEYYVRASRSHREGIFEIDLQLRPYGKAGSLAVAIESYQRYFRPGGPAWAYERQALTRMRNVAGNPGLGRYVERLRDEMVYTGEAFDVTAMRAMRERQLRHLVSGGEINLKYSPGGLVDIEYLVQALQITHGGDIPSLRQTNTREALLALHQAGLLSDTDYTRLRKAHTFLRWFIDSMRVVRGNARDTTVPDETSDEFVYLARRLRYDSEPERLRVELTRYLEDVREINTRMLG